MTTLQDALQLYLSGQSTLGEAGSRVLQDSLDQDTDLPAIVVGEPVETGGHHQAGADGLVEARANVEAWATTKAAAAEIQKALRELLDGYPRGTLGGSGQTIDVEGIHLENRYLHDHAGDEASDTSDFQAILDLTVWYRESVPDLH